MERLVKQVVTSKKSKMSRKLGLTGFFHSLPFNSLPVFFRGDVFFEGVFRFGREHFEKQNCESEAMESENTLNTLLQFHLIPGKWKNKAECQVSVCLFLVDPIITNKLELDTWLYFFQIKISGNNKTKDKMPRFF